MLRKKGFKQKTYLESKKIKESKIKGKIGQSKAKKTRVSKTKAYYKELLDKNKWIKSIPQGSHGSTSLQKKLWKLVSDYVRIRDFLTYGTCISCNKKFDTWKEANSGHYRAYSLCKGMNKFRYQNCFAQCALCNSRMNEDKFEGGRIFANNIIYRHGQEWFEYINTFTKGEIQKIETPEVISQMKLIIDLMNDLTIKPEYYSKICSQK